MIAPKDTLQELLASMESVMVTEFRLCQSLRTLTQEERQALLDGKVEELTALTEKKEAILDELSRSEEIRQRLADQMVRLSGLGEEVKTLSDLLPRLDSPVTERLSRLREGILTLQAEVRELNRGNYALATLNLERLGALQNFLVNLYSTNTSYYAPSGSPSGHGNLPTSISMDHRA